MIKRQTERFTVFSVESDEARARRAVFESLAALDYDEAKMASRSERKALGKEREGTLTYGERLRANKIHLTKFLSIKSRLESIWVLLRVYWREHLAKRLRSM